MLGSLSLPLIVASSALSAALAGYAAWSYQGARYEAKLADMRLASAQAIRTQEQHYAELVRQAEAGAKSRERAARVDAARARDVADGLRSDLARAVRAAQDAPATCPERAAAVADVLVDVERAGRELAASCDRHANDIRTLMDAWPR